MSVWKFWNNSNSKQRTKDKSEDEKDSASNLDPVMEDGEPGEYSPETSPTFERHKNRHQMSVSRSGRYKQRQRKRSGILDNPDFVDASISHEKGLGSERQLSEGCPDFCGENELYGRPGSDTYPSNGRKDEFKCDPRRCNLQQRAEFQVVAI